MLILLTIFLFLFIPLLMLIIHLVRPKLNIQGFLALLAVMAGWILVLLAHSNIPQIIALPQWEPRTLFPLSPSLLVDESSWFFSLSLTTLALSVIIASIAQLGQSPSVHNSSDDRDPKTASIGVSTPEDQLIQTPSFPPAQSSNSWVLWASILALTSLGLLAVTAGNLLTLLLAWVAVDLLELLILLGQLAQSRTRERIIMAFSARMAGVSITLIAGVMLWSRNGSLTFDSLSQPIGAILIITAGLRLGVLPLHLPFIKGLPIDRNIATVLRLVPAVSSYILLLRLSVVGLSGTIVYIFLGLTILAGIYAAFKWLQAKDELDGRPYWLLGISSLVVSSAILHQPLACLAWSIAGLLSGGFIFSLFLRHKNLVPLIVLGIVNLSTLPFTPAWQGVSLYQFSSSLGINLSVFALFSISFLAIQVFLLAGFIRHALRGIIPPANLPSAHTERWVWFLYPVGLVFLVLTHIITGVMLLQDFQKIPLSGWIMGPVVAVFSGLAVYVSWRSPHIPHPEIDPGIRSAWDRILSLDWLYRFLWLLFRSISRLLGLVSIILEGDGGILWALVIFGLIFVFMQR